MCPHYMDSVVVIIYFYFLIVTLWTLFSYCYIVNSGEGNGNPLQYSCLENSMDRGAWWATVHGVAKSRTWLNKSHTHTHTHTRIASLVTQSSAISSCRGSSQPRNWTQVSCISCVGRQILYCWAVGEASVYTKTVKMHCYSTCIIKPSLKLEFRRWVKDVMIFKN